MNTKLNAEEMAEKRYPLPDDEPAWDEYHKQLAYAAAIREVAQPLADERDELREALQVIVDNGGIGPEEMFHNARSILAKYPKP